MEDKRNKQLRKRLVRLSLLGVLVFGAGVALVMTGTRPESVGLLGIIGFFILVYGAVMSFLLLLYSLRAHRSPIRFRAILRIAVLALGPVMLLAMSSTSSLRALDLGLVVLFEIAAIFYIGRVA